VFAAKGYAGARVQEIADRAGVNKQLINYYFDSKEGLYRELQRTWQRRERVFADADLPLDELAACYLHDALAEPRLLRLMAWRGLLDQADQPPAPLDEPPPQPDAPNEPPGQADVPRPTDSRHGRTEALGTASEPPDHIDPAGTTDRPGRTEQPGTTGQPDRSERAGMADEPSSRRPFTAAGHAERAGHAGHAERARQADPPGQPSEPVSGSIGDLASMLARQASSEVAADLDPASVRLAMMGAVMAPVVLPQLVRQIFGLDPSDPEFERRYAEHLRRMIRRLGNPPS
jgi:AcrR family transcriptional regulator